MNAHYNKPVLLCLLALLAGFVRGAETTAPKPPAGTEVAPGVRQIGRIEHPRITESSGVVASRHYPGVFWTHTDGGGPKKQVFCALTREGKTLATYHLIGVTLHDWEDIAIDGQRHLYVGDIGNNNAERDRLAVYQIDEPNPKAGAVVTVKQSWRLKFPKEPFDCEGLFIWEKHGYVVSKVFNDRNARLCRFPLAESKEPVVLESLGKLAVDSPVTGADISPDGQLLGLVTHAGAMVFRIDGDPSRARQLKPYVCHFKGHHIEGCCFVPEGLLATSESREIYLFTGEPFRSSATVPKK